MSVQRKYLELFLEEGAEILAKLGQAILRLEAAPGEREPLQSALRLAHTLKGGAKMVGLDNVSRVAHEMEATLQATVAAGRRLDRVEGTRILALLDRVRGVLELVSQGREGEALAEDLRAPSAAPAAGQGAAAAPAAAPDRRIGADRVRVSVEKLDELQNLVDDLTLQRARLTGRARKFRRALAAVGRLAAEGGEPLTASDAAAVRQAARLLGRSGFAEFLEDLHRLDRVASEIQTQVFDLRMVPLAEVLDEYQRTVRDLGHELGKDVALTVDGKFTEIDKRLLEAIQAPLTHLVRNAVDHGVESAEERRRSGKPPRAEVTIRAYHKGSAVVVEVEDDGRGLDPEEIRAKAVERGVLTPEQAVSLDEAEVFYLLCEPGFTTRGEVTEISGRGVGLDVVKVRVEKLKGSLVIQSEKGRFSRFRLYLPLSISTLSTLVVRVGSEAYAIPSLFVDRCLHTAAAELAQRDGTWPYGDRVLPVVSLGRALGAECPASETAFLVVLRFRGRHMVLQVDELLEEREVVLKGLGEHLREVPFVLGASFLADGPPVPVLNVVDLHGRWAGLEAACRYQPGAVDRPAVVLVVDDSVTTRHMEQNLLEHMGYTVLAAPDGVEAWKTLERASVDAVLTDVEMPGMDGLELTRRIRARSDLAGLPVVAVSNRTADSDLAAGYEAGVSAYLSKDRFNQRELGETLRGLLARGSAAGGSP